MASPETDIQLSPALLAEVPAGFRLYPFIFVAVDSAVGADGQNR
jgi:hypothetical protein